MPTAPKYPCTVGGCRYFIPCPQHSRAAEDRGYYGTAAWRRIAHEQLQLHPYCHSCQMAGRGLIKASVVDHRRPRRSSRDDRSSNLVSLCRRCHAIKRQSERLADLKEL